MKKDSSKPTKGPAPIKLWKHQQQTKNFATKQPRMLDLSDPGTGKTRVHLETWAENHRGRAIVLAPKTLLETAWLADAMKFLKNPNAVVAYAENRQEAFSQNADLYITNIDGVKWLAKQPKTFWRKFGSNLTLIIDEITAFKHRTSDRSKALRSIKDHFTYRTGMTGTFTSNTICDAWHQTFIIDDGMRLGRQFFQFRNAVCIPVQVGPKLEHLKWEDKPGAEEAVYGLIKDISVRHKFDECMDIPPNFIHEIDFRMNAKHRRAYEDMQQTAMLFIKNEVVNAVHAASVRTKLLQIASGAVYNDSGRYVLLDTSRYELIADLVEERRHSVVFFNWRHQKAELVKELAKRKISFAVLDGETSQKDRIEIVNAYQEGQYQTLLLHPATGAHGLTLTRGKAVIWCSPIDQADYMKQGIHRIVRGGQTEKTETLFIKATGTIEGKVYARTQDKTDRMMTLMNLFS